MFDEEMEQMDGRRNTFTDWSDEETDGEIDDHDVNKILIVTQTPPYLRKHPGGDRTGQHTSRAKLSSELVKVINDGLFYYEQDLWDDTYEPEYATIKVRKRFDFIETNASCRVFGSAETRVCDVLLHFIAAQRVDSQNAAFYTQS